MDVFAYSMTHENCFQFELSNKFWALTIFFDFIYILKFWFIVLLLRKNVLLAFCESWYGFSKLHMKYFLVASWSGYTKNEKVPYSELQRLFQNELLKEGP